MRKAVKSEESEIIDVLLSAFDSLIFPNSMNFVVKQDDNRTQRLRGLLEYQVKKAFEFGAIYVNEELTAVILFLDPKKSKLTIKVVLWELKLVLKTIGIENVFKVIKREELLKRFHPTGDFKWLWLMGVSNFNQQKGLGGKLLDETLDHYKNDVIYLETTTIENVKFYKNHGFKVTDKNYELDYPLFFLRKG